MTTGYVSGIGINGGSSSTPVPVVVSGSPFADYDALDTWSQANPSELLNNENFYATAELDDGTNYQWEGADGVYSANGWIRVNGLNNEEQEAVDSIVNAPDNEILVTGEGTEAGTLVSKGITVSDTDIYTNGRSITVSVGSVNLGGAQSISSAGRNVATKDLVSQDSRHSVWQTFEDGNTAVVRVRTTLPPITVSDKTADLVNPVWTQAAATVDQTVKQVVLDFTNAVTNFVVELDIGGVDFFKENLGDFAAGEQTVILNPPTDVFQGDVVTFKLSSEDGDVTVKGNSGTGIPYQVATIASWVDESISGSGDVTGPSSSIDQELSIFNGTTGDQIDGGTKITADNTVDNASLTLSTNDNSSYPEIRFTDSSGTLEGRIYGETDDGTLHWRSTTDSYISASGGIEIEADGGELSVQTLGGNNISIDAAGQLNVSGSTIDVSADADTNLDLSTSGAGILGLTAGGAGDLIMTATTSDIGIVANNGQVQVNTQDVELDLNDGKVSSTGNDLTIEASGANSDVSLVFNDNTSSEVAKFYWDQSQVSTRIESSANFSVESQVQLNMSGLSNCTYSAGLNLGLVSGTGVFAATPTDNQFPLALSNSGANGTRADIYVSNSNPDGVITAQFGRSFCFVRDATSSDDDGLWYLNTDSTNQNTPWVQIASTNHTTGGVTGPSSSVNTELAVFNGATGNAIEGTTNITAAVGQNNAKLDISTTDNANDPEIWFNGASSQQEGWIYLDAGTNTFHVRGANSGYYSAGTKLDIECDAGDLDIKTQTSQINITAQTNALLSSGSGNTTVLSNAGNVQVGGQRILLGPNADVYVNSLASEATGFAVTIQQGVANGGTSEIVAGNRNPNGNVNATNERIYLRSGSGSSDIYVGVGTSNTDWNACGGRGAPWQWGNNGVNSSNTQRFMSPGIDFNDGAGTNEGNLVLPITRDGYFQRMRVRHNDPNGNGNNIVYTLRVNGSDSALSVTLASDSTVSSNNGTRVSVSTGDTISIGVTKPQGGVNNSPNNVNVQIDFY